MSASRLRRQQNNNTYKDSENQDRVDEKGDPTSPNTFFVRTSWCDVVSGTETAL